MQSTSLTKGRRNSIFQKGCHTLYESTKEPIIKLKVLLFTICIQPSDSDLKLYD